MDVLSSRHQTVHPISFYAYTNTMEGGLQLVHGADLNTCFSVPANYGYPWGYRQLVQISCRYVCDVIEFRILCYALIFGRTVSGFFPAMS